MPPSQAAAIIPAGGSGSRLGGALPKQFLPLAGQPLILHTLAAVAQVTEITSILVAAPPAHHHQLREWLAPFPWARITRLVAGGPSRQASVANALAEVPAAAGLILVHDAARPLVEPALIRACLEEAGQYGAALAALPAKDTIKEADDGRLVRATLDRSRLWLAQTPQAARADLMRRAFAVAARDAFVATDEAALLERIGCQVRLVAGSETNLKVTRPMDLEIVEALLMKRQHPSPANLRVGHGYDVHRLVPDRPLILAGVRIRHHHGLLGHSDADVLCHALCDAILGGCGAGDIGRHFPDSDPRYRGISSLLLLEEVMALARGKGFQLLNMDLTVVAQQPRLAPHLEEMRDNLARVCQVAAGAVSLKATTTEGLGFSGRGEGIAAHAVVLLSG